MAREPIYRAAGHLERSEVPGGCMRATNDTTYLPRLSPEEDVECRFTGRYVYGRNARVSMNHVTGTAEARTVRRHTLSTKRADAGTIPLKQNETRVRSERVLTSADGPTNARRRCPKTWVGVGKFNRLGVG